MNGTIIETEETKKNKRPEWVHCIKSDRVYYGYYGLCGRFCGWEFMFQSLEHAKLSVEHGSRLVPCDECLKTAEGGGL